MKIYLLGFMGSGKTHWGRHLSAHLGVPLFDMDEMIVKRERRSIAGIFTESGEGYFREQERNLLRELAHEPRFVISCGGGVPCFFDNMAFMNTQGLTIWLNPPVNVMVKRLERKKGVRPLIDNMEESSLKDFVEKKLEERGPFYGQAALIVDPVPLSVVTFAEKIKQCKKHI